MSYRAMAVGGYGLEGSLEGISWRRALMGSTMAAGFTVPGMAVDTRGPRPQMAQRCPPGQRPNGRGGCELSPQFGPGATLFGYQGAVGDLMADEAKLTPAQVTALEDLINALSDSGTVVDIPSSTVLPGATSKVPPSLVLNIVSASTSNIASIDAVATSKGFTVVQAATVTTDTALSAVYTFPAALGGMKPAAPAPEKSNTMLWVLGAVAAVGVGVLAARSGRGGRMNPAGSHELHDHDEDDELILYADNTGELYDSKLAVLRYMKREMARGAYDHGLGIERWRQWLARAARMYKREIPDYAPDIDSASVVGEASREIEHREFVKMTRGEYDWL